MIVRNCSLDNKYIAISTSVFEGARVARNLLYGETFLPLLIIKIIKVNKLMIDKLVNLCCGEVGAMGSVFECGLKVLKTIL